MNADMKRAWLAALRSGDYAQGRDTLLDAEGRYCCLGVLCVVAGERLTPGVRDDPDQLNDDLYRFVDTVIGERNTPILTERNDVKGDSFAAIADWIEANL